MKKLLGIMLLFAISISAQAQECADSVASLKNLVGNSDLPLSWKENTNKNPLFLTLTNTPGAISLKLRTAKGEWADATGVICKKGSNYVAKVNKILWGPEAPGIAKASGVKEIKLKLPYQSLLKVSVSLVSLEFSPL